MDVYLRTDINFAAALLLGIIIIIALRSLDRKDNLNRIFLWSSFVIIIQLLVEALTCFLNGQPGRHMIIIQNILHIVLFIAAPTFTLFWLLLIEKLVGVQPEKPRWIIRILMIPYALNVIITLLSPIFHLVFTFNANNVYQRGPFFFFSAAVTYMYIIIGFWMVLRNRKKMVKEEFAPLVVFSVLPMIGGLFQSLFYGVLLMWSTAAFSLVIVYVFLQQRMIHLDKLSGAWIRESFDYYIEKRIQLKKDDPFGAIYFDVDNLKKINDLFGHSESDESIRLAVSIIRKSLSNQDKLVRLGGDEFIVIVNCISLAELNQIVEGIKANFSEYNRLTKKPYRVDCSFGYDVFTNRFNSIQQFMSHLDALMYRSKHQKKTTSKGEEG